MSDNLKRYLAILGALKQLCPSEPQGNYLRHLHTMAAMISGIVGSQRTSLSAVANKMPGTQQRQSRIQRLTRWLKNERITGEAFFLPFASELLCGLPKGPLVLVMDGSQVGRGCLALVMSVLFGKRALPLAFLVVEGKKGHFPEEKHLQLLGQVAKRVPQGREVIFLGDGEFDGCGLLRAVQQQGWQLACRTAKNVVLSEEQASFGFCDLSVQPGELLSIPDVAFTGQGFSAVTVVICPLFMLQQLPWSVPRFLSLPPSEPQTRWAAGTPNWNADAPRSSTFARCPVEPACLARIRIPPHPGTRPEAENESSRRSRSATACPDQYKPR